MPKGIPVLGQSPGRTSIQFCEDFERVKNAERMQFIRDIAAGLAHEIVNPITGIKGALEVFYRERDLSAEDRLIFEEMLHQVRKLDVLTRSFLDFTRPPSPRLVPTSIHETIGDALALVASYDLHRNFENVSVEKQFDESVPMMDADPLQLQQVFLNLILNALNGMNGRGTLRFETAHLRDYVEVRVSDTGPALDSDVVDKIFQPFFTTETRGFGVGLSMSKRLIEQHGGDIAAESGDSGTVFRITLPIREDGFRMG